MEEKLILRQSNKISRAPTVPGLRQAKAYRYLLMKAKESHGDSEYHIVYQEELKKFLGSNDWETLKESIEALKNTEVRWDLLPQKGGGDELLWGSSPLLADCEIRKEINGNIYFKYSFSPKMRDELFNPKFYRDFDLSIIRLFQSGYSLKFYEFCNAAINPKDNFCVTEYIPKEKFWELLGLNQDEYPNYFNFKKRVVKPAVKEVNEMTNLCIDLERKKISSRNYAYRFKIKRQNIQMRLPLNEKSFKDVSKKLNSASESTRRSLAEEFLKENPFLKNKKNILEDDRFLEWVSLKYQD